MLIRPVEPADRPAVTEMILGWVRILSLRAAGSITQSICPDLWRWMTPTEFVGLVTFTISGAECEIVTLDALAKDRYRHCSARVSLL